MPKCAEILWNQTVVYQVIFMCDIQKQTPIIFHKVLLCYIVLVEAYLYPLDTISNLQMFCEIQICHICLYNVLKYADMTFLID